MKGTEKTRKVGAKLRDPDLLAEFYRESGYDGAVLSQPFYMGHDDRAATGEANDALHSDVVDEYEEFWGLAALPVGAGGSVAAEEFERCLENGYHGGGLPTRVGDVEIDHESLDPVFDVAEAYDAPLMVHPKLEDSLGPDVFNDEGRYFLNAQFGREAALCASVIRAIQGGVFDDHPDLKLVYHHTGGNIAAMLGRVHLVQQPGWWAGQDHVWANDDFREVLESNVYLDTSGYLGYMSPIRTALEEFPVSQILLGTDCPFEARDVEDMAHFIDVIENLTSHTDRRRILGENTLGLLANA